MHTHTYAHTGVSCPSPLVIMESWLQPWLVDEPQPCLQSMNCSTAWKHMQNCREFVNFRDYVLHNAKGKACKRGHKGSRQHHACYVEQVEGKTANRGCVPIPDSIKDSLRWQLRRQLGILVVRVMKWIWMTSAQGDAIMRWHKKAQENTQTCSLSTEAFKLFIGPWNVDRKLLSWNKSGCTSMKCPMHGICMCTRFFSCAHALSPLLHKGRERRFIRLF